MLTLPSCCLNLAFHLCDFLGWRPLFSTGFKNSLKQFNRIFYSCGLGVADKYFLLREEIGFTDRESNKRCKEVNCCCLTHLNDCYWMCGTSFDLFPFIAAACAQVVYSSPTSDAIWLSFTVMPLLFLLWEIWAYRQD